MTTERGIDILPETKIGRHHLDLTGELRVCSDIPMGEVLVTVTCDNSRGADIPI